MNKFLRKLNFGYLLILSYFIFLALSWIILFRDGRALFTFVDFYPNLRQPIEQTTVILQKLGINFVPTLIFAITGVSSFCLYYLSLKRDLSLKNTIKFSAIFQLITFFAYPILARDIFYYIFSDRVLNIYHQNVWKIPVSQFAFDKFSKTDWQIQTKVYGGVNQFFYNFASWASGNDFIRSIFFYKFLALIFSFIAMYLVYIIAKKYFPKKEVFILRFIFWNPLYVLEIAGAGHNDIIMIVFLLLTLYFYLGKNWIMAGVSLGLSVGVKMAAALFFPFLLIDAIAKKQFKNSIEFASTFLIVNVLTFKYMDIDPIFFVRRVVENAGVFWQGLPSLAYKFYPTKNPFFLLGELTTSLGLGVYQIIKRANPIVMYVAGMFIYLEFFSSAYWNWYVLWAFIFIPFIKNAPLKKAVFALSFTSLLAYPLYWISLRFDYQNIIWQFIFYLWIFAIPLLTLLYSRRNKNFLSGLN